jgi:hypothetical protein
MKQQNSETLISFPPARRESTGLIKTTAYTNPAGGAASLFLPVLPGQPETAPSITGTEKSEQQAPGVGSKLPKNGDG